MMNATERERALRFAHEHVAVPWRAMVAAAGKIAKGETLSAAEARLQLPLAPFTADARVLYPLMRDFVGLLTWQPNNLFTIILEDDRDAVCRAYLELTRDNNFIEMLEVDPQEPLLQQALELIGAGNLADLRWRLDDACRARFNQRVNWVKVARLRFFSLYADAWEVWEKTGDLWAWIKAALSATRQVYAEKLLFFGNEPPLFARMRELMSGTVQIDPAHLPLAEMFGPLPKETAQPVVVALVGRDYLAALKMGGRDPLHLTIDPEAIRECAGLPLKQLTKQLAVKLNAKQVLAWRTEPLANLVYEAVRPPQPWGRDDSKLVLRRALEMTRAFGEQWQLYPRPFYLKDWVRGPARLLGSPYDISRLSYWFMPVVIIDGMDIFLGQHNCRSYVVLDGNRPQLMISVEVYRSGLRKIRTHDPAEFADIFADMRPGYEGTRAAAREVSLRLWEKGHGFQTLVSVMRQSTVKTMLELFSVHRFARLHRLFGLIWPLRRLLKELKAGGIAAYPDRMLVQLEKWVAKAGRLRIYSNVVNWGFDRSPRSRGLLYIKETVIGLVLAGLLTAGIIALF